MASGVELIAAERERQVTAEGWTAEHDDEHFNGELADAASIYIDYRGLNWKTAWVTPRWPFEKGAWKPSHDKVRDLVRAGALIAAEIDRLQRLASEPTRDEQSGGSE